jgi:N4-gp56 family major capsid protein
MAMMTTASPSDLITQFQTAYSDKLLPKTEQLLVYDQFATKSAFPKNRGAKTIRMHRKLVGAASNVATASEGVAPSTYREIDLEYVEATLVQYVEALKFSDVLGMTELFNSLIMSRDSLAEDMALHADQIVRNVIVNGVTTNKFFTGGNTTWAALAADTTSGTYLTIQDLLRAMTALQIQRAPKLRGNYYAIVPPQVAYDLMLDTKFFIPTNTYQDKSNVIKGEVGTWWGVKVVIGTVPFREATNGAEGTFSSSGTIYTSVVTGADAYGTPIMAGNSPYTPKIYVNDGPEKVDPANQFTIVAAKSFWAALMLQEKWAVTIRSKTSYA